MNRCRLKGLGLLGMALGLAALVMLSLTLEAVRPAAINGLQMPAFRLGLALLIGLAITAGAIGLTLMYLCALRSLPRFDDAPENRTPQAPR